jgi:hypothetical protein
MSYHCYLCLCRFQIVDLPGAIDSDANNGSWRIGDWADTLELPNIGLQAIVRWIPGPLEITGRGFLMIWYTLTYVNHSDQVVLPLCGTHQGSQQTMTGESMCMKVMHDERTISCMPFRSHDTSCRGGSLEHGIHNTTQPLAHSFGDLFIRSTGHSACGIYTRIHQ